MHAFFRLIMGHLSKSCNNDPHSTRIRTFGMLEGLYAMELAGGQNFSEGINHRMDKAHGHPVIRI